MNTLSCSGCGTLLTADDCAGKTACCPKCGRENPLPQAPHSVLARTIDYEPVVPSTQDRPTSTVADAVVAVAPPSGETPARSPGGERAWSLPQIDGYEVLEELGRGGMGVVYKARQQRPRRTVALKMILAAECASPDQVARFFAEAEVVARLQHANIVHVHEVGEHDGYPYLTLEYLEGGTLAKKLSGRPLAEAEAAALVETLAQAIEHAHQKGVVHRDLKPSNVLYTAEGAPKVADFGLAKQVEMVSLSPGAPRTQTGAILGTPSYMSPEQASGKVAGPATDIYSWVRFSTKRSPAGRRSARKPSSARLFKS